jgi:anti-sigma regulatory factor (Ser/Thr protein kinase)
MDVTTLIKRYIGVETASSVSIDVFDRDTIDAVYRRVIGVLKGHLNIELGVLQALSYCFYEVLDNVLIHAEKHLGTIITYNDEKRHELRIVVADDGIGVHQSLKVNELYRFITEEEALHAVIKDKVTDGQGLGFGLYATYLLIKNTASSFEIRSGNHCLKMKGDEIEVVECEHWQGTVVYMQLRTDVDIDPNAVVEYRTDVEDEYDIMFNDNNPSELW